MKRFLLLTASALSLSATFAAADITSDDVVTALNDQGFDEVNVREDDGMILGTAVADGQVIHVAYDATTGELLHSETSDEADRPEGDATATGENRPPRPESDAASDDSTDAAASDEDLPRPPPPPRGEDDEDSERAEGDDGQGPPPRGPRPTADE